MRASYVPIYCGQDGPLQALLVAPSFSVKDKFIEVNITDKDHLRKLGVGLRQYRTLARVVHAGPGQPLRSDGSYCVYVTPQ